MKTNPAVSSPIITDSVVPSSSSNVTPVNTNQANITSVKTYQVNNVNNSTGGSSSYWIDEKIKLLKQVEEKDAKISELEKKILVT